MADLFDIATRFDPYGAFRAGQMEKQQYDIKQQQLEMQKMTFF